MINYFKKEFPVYYFLIALLSVSLVFFYMVNEQAKMIKTKIDIQSAIADKKQDPGPGYHDSNEAEKSSVTTSQNDNIVLPKKINTDKTHEKKVIRTSTNGLTRPILLVESAAPSEELSSLGSTLQVMLNKGKQDGLIHSASVYVNDLDNDNWIEVNDTEGYYPGSLMKLAVLICYLKKSEEHPEILDKTLVLEKNAIAPGQSYKDEVIRTGTPYKISDLLYQMIVRSDNFATLLLNRELDLNELNKLFNVLGLPEMDMHNIHYTITAKAYSKFMWVLFNASYLNVNNSQYALSMMSHSTFNKGLTRNLPPNVMVAHKFGENVSGSIRELHESGIVYTGSHTYLITVMTKGGKVSDLADEICNISETVYKYFVP